MPASPHIHTESVALLRKKINIFTEKHRSALVIAQKLEDLGLKERAERMRECSQELIARICPDCGKVITYRTNLCRDRLCPTCNWRLALHRYGQMRQVIDTIFAENEDIEASFITLTIKNCTPTELSRTLSAMAEGWDRMARRAFWRKSVLGWARACEITYNKAKDTMHPHYHIIALYRGGQMPTKEEIVANWKAAIAANYRPIISVEKIQPSKSAEDDNIIKAVLETFKYSVKSSDLESMSGPALMALLYGVKGKRMVAYGGIIKDKRAQLNMLEEMPEESRPDTTCSACGAQMSEYILKWAASDGLYKRVGGD